MLKRFRRGLLFQAHGHFYHSTLGSRVIQRKEEWRTRVAVEVTQPFSRCASYIGVLGIQPRSDDTSPCRVTGVTLHRGLVEYQGGSRGNAASSRTPPTPLTPSPLYLRASRCTLHPPPTTLHPAPETLHSTLYTLHSTPSALHPTPYTLNHAYQGGSRGNAAFSRTPPTPSPPSPP